MLIGKPILGELRAFHTGVASPAPGKRLHAEGGFHPHPPANLSASCHAFGA
ncbi:MAG: hypothetical protein N2438_12100 [Limisphaera sp.]|nr:hypothetical protein [Limisphaera sp.]